MPAGAMKHVFVAVAVALCDFTAAAEETGPSAPGAKPATPAVKPASAASKPASPASEPATSAVKPASSAEVDAFLEAWAAKSREVRSLAIRFRQEKKLRILRRPKVSEGDLAYEDGKLSVVVRGRDGEVESRLLLKDGELKILYPRLKRLEVIDVASGAGGQDAGSAPGAARGAGAAGATGTTAGAGGAAAGSAMGPSIPFFAGDPRDTRKDYDLELVRGEKSDRIALVPRDPKSPVKRIELRLEKLEVREYRQVDVSGDEVHMLIKSAEVNTRVPADRFELDLPEGTVVVRPAGK